MIGLIRTTCSAICMYLAMDVIVSTTHTIRSPTLVLAEPNSSLNIHMIRRLKLHSVFKSNGGSKMNRMRERKQWFKIIEQKYATTDTDNDTVHRASNGMGNGKGSKGYGKGKGSKGDGKGKGSEGDGKGKGKGKGMMMSKNVKGKGKGTRLPKVCRELDFENDDVQQVDDDGGFHGKGMGKSKKGKEKGYGSKMTMGKGFEKGHGMGKGKESHEKEGCRRNVFKKAKRIPDISIFVSLLEEAGLEDIFLCNGPFTVLAPSNTAFMNNTVVTKYLSDVSNVDELRDVLLYHILPGLTRVDNFATGLVDTLLDGDTINVTISPVMFNDVAGIEEGDFKACNGVIHIIDNILLPPGTIANFFYGLVTTLRSNFVF
jgi:uncharacterized surface protein with fasciclin (FAS1) repeats